MKAEEISVLTIRYTRSKIHGIQKIEIKSKKSNMQISERRERFEVKLIAKEITMLTVMILIIILLIFILWKATQ